jgi:pilus assembly protein CpaB
VAGAHVDVVVTTEGGDGAAGAARLALQDVEVLAAHAAGDDKPAPRVVATLRVSAAQAVYLTAAQSFARDVRLLARAPGDRGRVGQVAVGDGL